MVFWLIGFLCLSVLVWLAMGVRKIGAVSPGHRIEPRTNTALLLIDLQTVFWEHGPYDSATKSAVLATIDEEMKAAKNTGHPVIALRQEWSLPLTKVIAKISMNGAAIAGSPGTEVARPFADKPDHTLVKRVQDGFETGALDKLLRQLDVGTLKVVGLDGQYCVAKTILAARNRGYAVQVIENGVLTAQPDNWPNISKNLVTAGAEIV